MVQEELVARHLSGRERADVDVVLDLDVRFGGPRGRSLERAPVHDVAALDGHDLAPADRPDGKEPAAVNGAGTHARLGRAIRAGHWRLPGARDLPHALPALSRAPSRTGA
jgi:hypothetical protein